MSVHAELLINTLLTHPVCLSALACVYFGAVFVMCGQGACVVLELQCRVLLSMLSPPCILVLQQVSYQCVCLYFCMCDCVYHHTVTYWWGLWWGWFYTNMFLRFLLFTPHHPKVRVYHCSLSRTSSHSSICVWSFLLCYALQQTHLDLSFKHPPSESHATNVKYGYIGCSNNLWHEHHLFC